MLITTFDQIDASARDGHYMVALMAALSIPDICGALESPNGQASRSNFSKWFDQWVGPKYVNGVDLIFDGETCYYYRCAALHQARASHPKLGYSRVLFVEPGLGGSLHKNVLMDALNIDVQRFCLDITESGRNWWDARSPAAIVRNNLAQCMQRYPQGLAPYIGGIPVIG